MNSSTSLDPPPPHFHPPIKSKKPFISADHRPAIYDGQFRVVIISTGSVASVRVPNIIGALSKVVATRSSLHFYNQTTVDNFVREAWGLPKIQPNSDTQASPFSDANGIGVRVWEDTDEWSDWHNLGDPILHIELRRWADLVVVAPCSADMLARIASGLCDTLALSLLRALPSTTPVILCPAMNTHMYLHPYTAKHLKSVQEDLEYVILGPQGVGKLACGDEGPGKMTDWRDIVIYIQDFASRFQQEKAVEAATTSCSRLKVSTPYPGSSTMSASTSTVNGASEVVFESSDSIQKQNASATSTSTSIKSDIADPFMLGKQLWQQPGLPVLSASATSQMSMVGPRLRAPPFSLQSMREMGGQSQTTTEWPLVMRHPAPASSTGIAADITQSKAAGNVGMKDDTSDFTRGPLGGSGEESGRKTPPTPGGHENVPIKPGEAAIQTSYNHWAHLARNGGEEMWKKKYWIG